DVVGQHARDLRADIETFGMNAVVVGDEDAQAVGSFSAIDNGEREWRMASGEWSLPYSPFATSLFAFHNPFNSTHVGCKRIRHGDRAVFLLIGLHHRNERAADGDAGAVERVDGTHLPAFLGAIARIHAAGLEVAAHRARRNLAVRILPRQ